MAALGLGLAAAFAAALAANGATASGPLPDPTRAVAVPAALEDWIPWVLAGRDGERCPFFHGNADPAAGRCVWPGVLGLDVDASGARLRQRVEVLLPGTFLLPGDTDHWPEAVTVDERPAAVVAVGERPALLLGPGTHTIAGSFRWPAIPESLAIPADTGLVELRVGGAEVPHPERAADGRLALQRRPTVTSDAEEDRLEVAIYRRLVDDIPFAVITRLELTVAGKARPSTLPGVLFAEAIPVELASPLPARLATADGTLTVQLRPGTWRLEIASRLPGPVTTLAAPTTLGSHELPGEELWVFEARPALRVVDVEGVPAIDPSQTTLPTDWHGLPAYRLASGDELRLVTRQRGNEQAPPDRVHLARTLWLDVSGAAFSVRDHLQGDLRRAWRLELAPPGELGRASIDGVDQVLTRRSGAGGETSAPAEASPPAPVGIEVRQGRLDLVAESRLPRPGAWRTLPAVGWWIGGEPGRHAAGPSAGDPAAKGEEDDGTDQRPEPGAPAVDSLSAIVELPPGWRLFTTFGVDRASGTWTARWTLLDLFLVLVIGFAGRQLWGWSGGVLALAAAVVAYHEPGAPRWLWLAALAGAGLWRELSGRGWLRALLRGLGALAIVGLVLAALPFTVQQLRQAQNPLLERDNLAFGEALQDSEEARFDGFDGLGGLAAKSMEMEVAAQAPAAPVAESAASLTDRLQEVARDSGYEGRRKSVVEIDPDAQVSTGPGLPSWRWRQHQLSWSGPVAADHTVRLVLLSPGMSSLLALLRVVLLGWVLLRLLAVFRRGGDGASALASTAPASDPSAPHDASSAPGPVAARAFTPGARLAPATSTPRLGLIALGVLGGLLASGLGGLAGLGAAANAQTPPPELLEELRNRLLVRPSCHPECASASRLLVDADPTTLRLRLEVGAAAATAVPLPGITGQWQPTSVLVDGAPAGLVRDTGGTTWVLLAPGGHEILLAGPLPEREQVNVPLPLRPHRATARANGWSVDGIFEDGRVEDALRLTRQRGAANREASAPDVLEANALPALLEVERTLVLGLRWRVETRVRRLSPTGVPAQAEIPLLPGERVATAAVRASEGRVAVSLGPQAVETGWSSVLDTTAELALVAPETAAWTERWRLEASPIWHVTASGIPAVHEPPGDAVRTPVWRPWPGERLQLGIERPAGVPGQALTIDRSELTFTPGPRFSDASLEVTLRASRGGTHQLTLPAGAELQSFAIDGSEQPARQTGQRIAVPIRPGTQTVSLRWREPRGQGWLLGTPGIDLGLPSVNHTSTLSPGSRWVLAVGGAMAGPSVLFWSLLVVLAALAWGLARLGTTPLSARDWLLLGIGLSQIPLLAGALVAAWILALGWRHRALPRLPGWRRYDLVQLVLLGATPLALGLLVWGIQQGLLGSPEMQITGNGSYGQSLRWFADRAEATPPGGWMFSVPIAIYRLAMLAWALWLASRLLGWLRWAWTAFSEGGLWRAWPRWRRTPAPATVPDGATPPAPAGEPAGGSPAAR
jgi:hypothetical protein